MNNQPIWEQDLMPEKSVVIDFYQEYKLSQDQQNQAQWRVISGEWEWMIYQWYEGTGTNDDVYLYEVVK